MASIWLQKLNYELVTHTVPQVVVRRHLITLYNIYVFNNYETNTQRSQGSKYIICGAGKQLVIQKTADLPSVYGTWTKQERGDDPWGCNKPLVEGSRLLGRGTSAVCDNKMLTYRTDCFGCCHSAKAGYTLDSSTTDHCLSHSFIHPII